MFDDPRSRRAWRLFRMRAEYTLGAVSGAARRELLEDLEAHVREALRHRAPEEDEFSCVEAALASMGDPRDFLGPLIADAVLRRPAPPNNLMVMVRAPLLAAQQSATAALASIGLLFVIVVGAASVIMACWRLLSPTRAGVFWMGADIYEVRLLGVSEASGTQILPAWLALLVIAVGGASIWLALRSLRRMIMRLLVS